MATSDMKENISFSVEITSTGPTEGESGPLHSFIEHVMTYSFPFFWVANLYLAVTWLSELGLLWTILIAFPLAWIIADFVSGMMHWSADTYGTEDTPVLGKLIKPFRHHHVDPQAICRHDFVLTVGNVCILAVPLLGVLLYSMVGATAISGAKAFIALSSTLLTSAGVATNIFHRWAHAKRTNWFITLLQNSRLILKSDHHDLHHSRPFDSNYCITVGWLNPLLERIDFFRKLERILSWIGLKPAFSCVDERTTS